MEDKTRSWRERLSQGVWPGVVVICLFLLAPGRYPGLGWLHFLLPLPVFVFLRLHGWRAGLVALGQSLAISLAVAAAAGQVPLTVFGLAFIPVGIALFLGAEKGRPPAAAGGLAFAVLAAGWLLFWLAYAAARQTNPYTDVLAGIDASLEAAYPLYLKAAGVPEEQHGGMAESFAMIRRTLPLIFPAMLATSGLMIVCLNMMAGNRLLKMLRPQEPAPWPEFHDWRLPEWLVWAVILTGLLFFPAAEKPRTIALNGCVVLLFLYLIQGLAVLATLLRRWPVPTPLKALIYLLTIIHGYGALLLAALGLVDIWADFKKNGASPDRGSR